MKDGDIPDMLIFGRKNQGIFAVVPIGTCTVKVKVGQLVTLLIGRAYHYVSVTHPEEISVYSGSD